MVTLLQNIKISSPCSYQNSNPCSKWKPHTLTSPPPPQKPKKTGKEVWPASLFFAFSSSPTSLTAIADSLFQLWRDESWPHTGFVSYVAYLCLARTITGPLPWHSAGVHIQKATLLLSLHFLGRSQIPAHCRNTASSPMGLFNLPC